MVILGIDPGLANTGFGAITVRGGTPALVRCGYVKTATRDRIEARLSQIYGDMAVLMDDIGPDIVALENVFSLVRYPRAGILLGSVLGVICLAAFQRSVPLVEITPKEVKNALVGYGSANKDQVRKAVERSLGINDISSLHAADALAVALTAYYRKAGAGIR